MSTSTNPQRIEIGPEGFHSEDSNASESAPEKGVQAESDENRPSSIRRPGEKSAVEEILGWLTRSFAILALLSSFALLCVGATPLLTHLPIHIAKIVARVWALLQTVPLSALPLLLAGTSYIVLQTILRPRPLELIKRLMLGIAFLLWGVVQLMPASDLATELGNLVIALYVVDLGLIIWTELEKNQSKEQ